MVFVGDWMPLERSAYLESSGRGRVIANLECAFAEANVFSGKAYTSILSTHCFDNVSAVGAAVSLANNHVYDAGDVGFDFLAEELERRGVCFFGTRKNPYFQTVQGGSRIAVIGCLEPCRSRGKKIFRQEDVVALIKKMRGDFDSVYVYPHWGKEGEYTCWPSPRQRELAKTWIDAGADGVYGSHSHVFQGKESYKGKPIYYSLGNFYFPHPESKLYEGTDVGLCVEIAHGNVSERFVRKGVQIEDAAEIKQLKDVLESISKPLKSWTTWKWARAVGPFNLKKNTASWNIRLRKSFVKTLPKFLVWQLLPKTLLFRAASLCK